MENRCVYFFDKHWEIIDLFIWCKFFISLKNIYNTTQHLDVIANHANVWMIQIKRYLIQLLFIWADLQEFCQFIIFALLLEPFWYLLVTVALDQTICGLMLEVQSCQFFYCKLGYWYLDLDPMDLHGLFLHCFSFIWSIQGKIFLLLRSLEGICFLRWISLSCSIFNSSFSWNWCNASPN